MANLYWDSELMTNYTEAVNVPAGKKLRACVDETSKQPTVFCLSNHQLPRLQILRVGIDGRRNLVDVSRLLDVPAGSFIETFDVQQSEDLTIFLSFSVKREDRKSDLWIVRPFRLVAELHLKALPVRSVGQIHEIQIGPYGSDGSQYPAIYLMHQPLDRTARNSDLAQIRVDLHEGSWEAWKELTLPQNVQKILDIAPTFSGFYGHGLVYLCEQNGNRCLYAVLVRPGEQLGDRGTATLLQLPCPKDALSIATFTDFTDDEQRSSLLIGCGAGVRLISADELTAMGGITTIVLNNDDCLTGARDLFVSQTEKSLSLFAINGKDELAYLTTTLADLKNARAAPILPANSVTSFAALTMLNNTSAQHSLICNDANGNLLFLQQALDTGIWRHEPFFVESSGEMIPFESYTVTIIAKDSKQNPVIGGKLQLQAPSTLSVIVNGRCTVLTPTASWHVLDSAGEIGLIIPTKTITSQPILVKALRDSTNTVIDIPNIRIDPAAKVMSRMSSFDSEQTLIDATTSEGESLWDNDNKPSIDDLKSAAKCFSAINDAYKTLPKDGSIVPRVASQFVGVEGTAPQTGNIFMDAFLWARYQAKRAINWIVRKAGQVWEFVCEIGGKIVNFVLDCVEKVTEAASWVWQKLKVGWEKLCKFVGFIFSWSDILETKDTIVGFLNAGLDMAANRVEGFNSKIDNIFSNIQKTVADTTGATSRPDFRKKVDPQNRKKDKQMDSLQESTPSKWAGERMKNGNAKQTVATKPPGSGDEKAEADLVKIWSDRVEPVLKDFNTLVDDLAKDIAALFKEDKNLSQEALLSRLGGNLLINILEVVKKLLQAVVSVVAKVVLIVKSFGNLKLTGGFLNSLYKWISKGKDLTIFEAVSLLIAIPSTFIIKLVTGAKAPTFKKLDADFVESITAAKNGDVSNSTSVRVASKQDLKDVATLVLGCGCGAALISVFHKNVKIAWKTVTGGVSVGVGAMSPSAIMELFGMAIDAFSLFKDIFVDPLDPETPGADLIEIATAVKCFRLAANALYMLANKLGMDNPVAEQVVACIDLITALINFSLYSAVYSKQLDATSWKDHDNDVLITATFDNFLETLSTIGYFTASTLKLKAPPAALAGMICFQAAAWGAVATKGITFSTEYKKL